jgi:hypothetical protein
MGEIKKHPPVKLIIGFIFQREDILNKSKRTLEKYFGKIDYESDTLAFTHTDYYRKEFGKNLKRRFVSFNKLAPPEDLPKIKIITNKIEKKLSTIAGRTINIDPGYLDLAKLVLASTKDYKHRIYLNRGILAEITLFFQDKTFQSWGWTYPDYRTAEYIAIFNKIRGIYIQQIKKE